MFRGIRGAVRQAAEDKRMSDLHQFVRYTRPPLYPKIGHRVEQRGLSRHVLFAIIPRLIGIGFASANSCLSSWKLSDTFFTGVPPNGL